MSSSHTSLARPLTTRSNTALRQPSASSSKSPPSPQEHTTTFSHKIRHMFDSSKYAIFLANVTIHELGNVPQLEGEFAVRWKFRGRRPRGKDGTPAPTPKPSLPNLRTNQPLSTYHPSTSTLSLQSTSTSTTTTSASSPINSLHSSSSRPILNPSLSQMKIPSKATSMPPEVMTPIPPRQAAARTVEKKVSDPTPLRQAIDANGHILPVASPEIMEEPVEDENLEMPLSSQRRTSAASGSMVSRGGSTDSNGDIAVNGSLLPAATIHDPQRMASAASSQSHLDVPAPKPRLAPLRPPARSGTLPSPSTLIGDEPLGRPPTISRTPSVMSNASTTSPTHSRSGLSHLNPLRRHHSTSGPGAGTLIHDANGHIGSSSRKGVTSGSRLKSHTCTWDYDLQHPLRIPLGRPIPIPSALSLSVIPGKARGPAPVLGAGPLSDSGIRLIVEQLPTSSATSGQAATGANKESLGSMVQAIHHVDHGKGNPSEMGKTSKTSVDEAKMTFGIVDVDLAAFAGKGRTTRRFLLKGSKTNATIKLTVDLKWIGGEERWAAPPMQEGHHVTGMHDLVGTEAQDKIRSDLSLAKTPSNTSSSSGPSPGTRSIASVTPDTMSRNVSSVSLSGPPPDLGYKSYEHHLRPDDKGGESRTSTPSRKDRHHHLSPVNFFRTNHHHHSHHIRDRSDPATPKSGIHDLPPEVIIEAVFNPHPANEEGPFTYVPAAKGRWLDEEEAYLQQVLESADPSTAEEEKANGKEHKFGWGGRMRMRKERKEREKLARVGP